MAFTLPDLPYAYDALGDYMSAETLEFHHDKHHKAYVDNGNKLAEEAGMSDKSLEEIVVASHGTNAGLFNNAAQHYNHVHFWNWMAPNGENPLVHGASPILGCDVWEHSYYIDYRNARPAYLEAFVDSLINWDYVAQLHEAATK